MSTFNSANQIRLSLKMKLSNFSWYVDSAVCFMDDGFGIIVHTSKIDDRVRKSIPPLIDDVSIKTEIRK